MKRPKPLANRWARSPAHGGAVAAVIRAGQLLIPKPDLVLRAHDELLAVVHAEDAGQLAALLG
ncbi:MAG: TrkA C-terminal domain-containing protein [Caldilineaceae bacterium]